MYFTNFVPPKHDRNVPVRSFVLYDPNLQRKPRKRKARSDEDQPKSSEKQSTHNGAGPKSSSVPSIQTPEPATQTSELSSESVDNEVIEIIRPPFCYDERKPEDKDKASNNSESRSFPVVEGTNAVVDSLPTNVILITAGETRSSCQPDDNGDSEQITLEGMTTNTPTTCTTATCTDDIFSNDGDMSSPNSCSSVATSTALKLWERPHSSDVIPVCSSETQDTEEFSNQLPVDVCASDFPRNGEDEDIVSNNTKTLDVDNRHGDAASSVDNIEELSEPVARSISPPNSVNQDVTSESVATEHDEIHNSIDVAGSPRRNSEPLSDDEEDRHEVEKIVDHRQRSGLTEYLVLWAGWPGSRNTWEPARNFEGCPGLVQEYLKSLKNCNSTSDDTDTRDPSNTRSDEISESDEDRYEIQKIVGHVEYNGWLRYDVEWSGGERTCEPASNLDQCRETVEKYWKELSSTNKATSIGDRSILFSDQLQDGEASEIHMFGRHILDSQGSLEGQQVQREISATASPRRTQCKRKRGQDDSVSRTYSKERSSKKKHRRRCGDMGHNKRTCKSDAVGVSD